MSISSCPELSKLLDDIISNGNKRKSGMSVQCLEDEVCNFLLEFFLTHQCCSEQSQHFNSDFLN